MTCLQCGQFTISTTLGNYCPYCSVTWPPQITTSSSTASGSSGYYQSPVYIATAAHIGPGLSQIWKDNPEYEEEIANLKSEISHLEEFVAKLLEKPGMTEELLKEMLSEDDRRVLEVLKKDAASV